MVRSSASSGMRCIAALSSALPAGSVRTTRWATPSSRRTTIAGVSSRVIRGIIADPESPAPRGLACGLRALVALLRVGGGVIPLVAVGEGLHAPAEQPMELLALGCGEDGGDTPLAVSLCPDGALPGSVALLGRLDELAAAVGGVWEATDEARGLEAVEAIGHRSAGETHVARQLARRSAVRGPVAAQPPEQVVLPPDEVMPSERRRHRLDQVLVQVLDVLHHALRHLI